MDNATLVSVCLIVISACLLVIAAAAVMTAVEVRRTLRSVHRITGACEAVMDRVAGTVHRVFKGVASLGQEARRWWDAPLEHVGNGKRRERRRT